MNRYSVPGYQDKVRSLQFLAILLLCVSLSFPSSLAAGSDPIVGAWKRMPKYGTFEDTRVFRNDGSLTIQMFGEVAKGTWKKSGDRYLIKPGGSDDYAKIVDGVLETYDSDGLIARYSRTAS